MTSAYSLLQGWLPEELVEEIKQSAHTSFTLDASIGALAASGRPSLAGQLAIRPAELQADLWKLLSSLSALPHGTRVWLRPTIDWDEPTLPDAAMHISRANNTPSALRRVTGVVSGVSAVENTPFEATYVCSQCGSEERAFGTTLPGFCCGMHTPLDLSRLVTIQTQTVVVTTPNLSAASGLHVGNTAVCIALLDDLVGSCAVGDLVDATVYGLCTTGGSSAAQATIARQGAPLLGDLYFTAVSVKLQQQIAAVNLPDSLDLNEEAQHHVLSMQRGDLGAMLDAMQAWARPPMSQMGQIALLLSVCCAGTAATSSGGAENFEEDPSCDALHLRGSATRSAPRVSVLLLSTSDDAALERSMHRIARALAPHVTHSTFPGAPLLPQAQQMHPSTPTIAAAGQLAEANHGVCLLSTSSLSSKKAKDLAAALHAGQAAVQLGPGGGAVDVLFMPTVWCLAETPEQQSTAKSLGKPWGKREFSPPAPPTPPTSQFISKFGHKLAAQFAVVLDCSAPGKAEVESWADQFLSSVMAPNDSATGAARAALTHHVTISRGLPPPRMTPAAMALLQGYLSALRGAAAEGPEGSAAAGVTLQGAALLAAASARLCHRDEIRVFPDAVLAVALCEGGMVARGWDCALWARFEEGLKAGEALGACLEGLYHELKSLGFEQQAPWEETANEE